MMRVYIIAMSNALEKDKKRIGTGNWWQQRLRPKMAMI
jgi:hypothetical protein